MKKGQPVYLVWQSNKDEDPDDGYYNQYDTLEDAVSGEGGIVEVYKATPRLVGRFKRHIGVRRVKTKKKAKK